MAICLSVPTQRGREHPGQGQGLVFLIFRNKILVHTLTRGGTQLMFVEQTRVNAVDPNLSSLRRIQAKIKQ